jgi:hypothetical protein
MFISKLEKQQINEWVNVLQMKVESLQNDVTFLTGKLKALEGKTKEPVKAPKTSKASKAPRPPRTEEQKLKQSAYMKEWHARRREEARAAKSAVLETV